jgi:hypothetical protein
MSAPTPPAQPKYNLLERDYGTAMPGRLTPQDLKNVTDKGLLYMIYREVRRTRRIIELTVIGWVTAVVLGGFTFFLAAILLSNGND